MTVEEFYNKMKGVMLEPVTIMDGVVVVYDDYMHEKKVYEYLFPYKIKSMYIGKNDSIIIEVIN